MARLLDALIGVDVAARKAVRTLGASSRKGRELQAAVREIRAAVAAAALHELAQAPDPKADLKQIFRACEAAGLSWPDLMDALNTYQESTPRLQ